MIKVSKQHFNYLILVLIVLTTLISDELNLTLRYIKYLLPFILLLALSQGAKIQKPDFRLLNLAVIFFFILTLNSIHIIFRSDGLPQFLKESLFILAPLIFVLLVSTFGKPRQTVVTLLMILPMIGYFATHIVEILVILKSLSSIVGSFVTSSIETESQLSFVLGFSYIYFLTRKRKYLTIISFLFVLLSFKRIVIGSCLLVTLLYFFIPDTFVKKNISLFRLMVFSSTLTLTILLYFLMEGKWNSFFLANEINLNALTQGRYDGYSVVLNQFSYFSFTGSGLGSVANYLDLINYPMLNLHNDHMKYLIEFGLLLYVVWLYSIIRFGIFNMKSLINTSYFMLVLLTDNISIYFMPLFYYYLIQSLNSNVEAENATIN